MSGYPLARDTARTLKTHFDGARSVTNLMTYSGDFRNTADAGEARPWLYTAISLVPDNATTPSGTLADKIVEDGTTATHRIYRLRDVVSGQKYTESFIVKTNGKPAIQIESRATSVVYVALFVFSTGVAVDSSGTGTASMENLGDGWFRCSITYTATATGSGYLLIYLTSTAAYLGDGSSGIWIADSQLENVTGKPSTLPSQYVATTTAAASKWFW